MPRQRGGERARAQPCPLPDEIQACLPWLDAQLTIIRPLVIVCLGAPSASLIIHKTSRFCRSVGSGSPRAGRLRRLPRFILPISCVRQVQSLQQGYQYLVQDPLAARQKVIRTAPPSGRAETAPAE